MLIIEKILGGGKKGIDQRPQGKKRRKRSGEEDDDKRGEETSKKLQLEARRKIITRRCRNYQKR
jgi:hypothetical protein